MDPAEPSSPSSRGGSLLGSPVARRILDLVRAHPGVTARDVAARLDLSWATVTYHRKRLERDGLLHTTQEGKRRLLHATVAAPEPPLAALRAMLEGGTMRRVAQAVQADPGMGEAELAGRLGLPPRALSYHLGRLVAAGLVEGSGPQRRDVLVPTPLLDLLLGEPPVADAGGLRDDARARR